MALLTATRTIQTPLVARFAFGHDDTMVDDEGNTLDFGLTNVADETTFVVIPLPPGAVVVGGAFTRSEAFDTAGYDVTVGDTADEDRYLATADLKAVGTTPLVPTGYVGTGENIVINIQCDDVCTQGQAELVVEYIVTDRATEVQVA